MVGFTPARGLQYLQRLGWSAPAAAGILGNLQHESNFNPTAVHDGGTGFGMAGWRDPSPGQGRKTGLLEFARRNGKDASDPYLQLSYLDHELRTSEAKTGDLLRTARTPTEAATVFLGFERPSGWSAGGDPTRASGYGNRVKYAEQIAGGQGADTMYGGAGGDTMTPAAQPSGGNGMAGQGLFNITPEVTDGLLATYQPTWQDKVGAGLSGLGAALAAAGSGNQNWGLLGGQAIQGAMKGRREEATQARREKAMQGLAQANPQLAALFALGGPESVGRVLAAQMMPGDPQGLMNVGGRVFDPNTKTWVTEAPAPEDPAVVRNLQGLGIDPAQLTPEQRLQAAGINTPDPTKYQTVTDGAGNVFAVDPTNPRNVVPIQGAQPKPQEQYRSLTAEEARARGLPAEGAYQIDQAGKVSQIGGSGITVNNNLGSAANQGAIRDADQALIGTNAAISAIDRALELNDTAASGVGSGLEQLKNRIFDPQAAAATTEMNTLITSTALEQLKAIFGGNPTEGERKILLDMQGAGNMTRAERAAVLRQARTAAERRMGLAKAQSEGLRSGDYYEPGYQVPVEPQATAPAPAAPQPPAAPQATPTAGVPAFEQMDAAGLGQWLQANPDAVRTLPDADYQRLLKRAGELEAQ